MSVQNRKKEGDRLTGSFQFQTIRGALLGGFISMALVITVAFTISSTVIGFFNGRQQATERLESVAALKDLELSTHINDLHDEVTFMLNENYILDRIQNVLLLSNNQLYYDFYFIALERFFVRFINNSQGMDEVFLLNLKGEVVLTSNPERINNLYAGQDFFQKSTSDTIATIASDPLYLDEQVLITATPVTINSGEVIGIIASLSNLDSITNSLNERTGLGESGRAYLVNKDKILITDLSKQLKENQIYPLPRQILDTYGVNEVIAHQNNGSGIYADQNNVRVIGTYRWIPDLECGLLVEQSFQEAFSTILATLGVNLIISFISMGLIIIGSIHVTNSIAQPLVDLSQTATSIANGDLSIKATMTNRRDEIGSLAKAFNSMTAQLRSSINELENRVAERTKALRNRAAQLEISAQVSREVTSILEIDLLLKEVVTLIGDAFGYSFINIYLVDEDMQKLVMRASSDSTFSEPQTMDMDQSSLNIKAVKINKAVVINETNKEPEFLNINGLPEVNTEVVIPLRIENRVIGTLDVNNVEARTFCDDEVRLLQSLGDQIAIAIHNARLYKQSQKLAIMEERNRLARDMHDSVTQSAYSMGLLIEGFKQMISNGEEIPILNTLDRMAEINQQILREMRILIHELKPPVLEQEGLLNAIQQRLDAVESRVGINARLITDELLTFPEEIEEDLYWITQEALNNAIKYSNANNIIVMFKRSEQNLILEISDDGVGFDSQTISQAGKLGIENMKTRAARIKCELRVESEPLQGCKVIVRIPRKNWNII